MKAQPKASHYINGRFVEDEGGAELAVIYPATGEKASDHILGKAPLPPSNQEPWINPRWRESDR